MKFGDTIRIEMKGKDGQSIFGAIEQEVVAPGAEPVNGRIARELVSVSHQRAGSAWDG